MIKMYGYLKHTWWQAILAVTALFLRVMADLSLPDYMMRIIDKGIVAKDLSYVLSEGKDMLMISFLVVILFFTSNFLASYIGSRAGDRIRKDIFKKDRTLFHWSSLIISRRPSLITRSTNDVQQVQQILTMSFRILLAAPLTGIAALIKAVELTPGLSWIFMIIFSHHVDRHHLDHERYFSPIRKSPETHRQTQSDRARKSQWDSSYPCVQCARNSSRKI